ncbi:MAG: DUF3185 domain-containing protein [Acidobacteria bacterium]|nr:DUF3185 domain-containing protein [Acidobacteriota bacterium]MBI3489917.1 DUF3185 domain-containing protein [Acidobacteriota bacterium]
MRSSSILAVALIVAGFAAIIYQSISYTTREKVVDIGSLHVVADQTRSIPLPPIVGAVAIVGGVLLLVAQFRRTNRS